MLCYPTTPIVMSEKLQLNCRNGQNYIVIRLYIKPLRWLIIIDDLAAMWSHILFLRCVLTMCVKNYLISSYSNLPHIEVMSLAEIRENFKWKQPSFWWHKQPCQKSYDVQVHHLVPGECPLSWLCLGYYSITHQWSRLHSKLESNKDQLYDDIKN